MEPRGAASAVSAGVVRAAFSGVLAGEAVSGGLYDELRGVMGRMPAFMLALERIVSVRKGVISNSAVAAALASFVRTCADVLLDRKQDDPTTIEHGYKLWRAVVAARKTIVSSSLRDEFLGDISTVRKTNVGRPISPDIALTRFGCAAHSCSIGFGRMTNSGGL